MFLMMSSEIGYKIRIRDMDHQNLKMLLNISINFIIIIMAIFKKVLKVINLLNQNFIIKLL